MWLGVDMEYGGMSMCVGRCGVCVSMGMGVCGVGVRYAWV